MKAEKCYENGKSILNWKQGLGVVTTAVLVGTTVSSWALDDGIEPTWKAIPAFQGSDKKALQDELARRFSCADPASPSVVIESCQKAKAAKILVSNTADLLAVIIPSTGNCGDFQFSFLGPTGTTGQRQALGGDLMQPACGEAMRVKSGPGGKAGVSIIMLGIDRVSAKAEESHNDELWEWTGCEIVLKQTLKVTPG